MVLNFESYNGNRYIYVDEIGMIFPNKYSDVFNNLDTFSRENNKTKWKNLLQLKYLKNKPNYIKSTFFNIKKNILSMGLQQLTLEVTEECNLRCNYCIYSEKYPTRRSFTSRYLKWPVAKKAIDYYLSMMREGLKINPNLTPTFTFYGGEPLLNFDLIKQTVEYVNNINFLIKPAYSITTNGTLLTKKISKFLVENDFSLAISLDGPKDEHDRNRVTQNKRGTFDIIIKNIDNINDKSKLHILPVFDYKSDIFKNNDFFQNANLAKPDRVSFVSTVSGSNYHESFSIEEIELYRQKIKKAKEQFFGEVLKDQIDRSSYFFHMFGTKAERTILAPAVLYQHDAFFPATGSCVPGKKIFVTVDGFYHICERVPYTFPIGDVDSGLNYYAIANIIDKYQKKVIENCLASDCPIKRLCGICFSHCMNNTDFERDSQLCKNRIHEVKKDLSFAATLGEYKNSFFSKGNFNYILNLKKYVWGD